MPFLCSDFFVKVTAWRYARATQPWGAIAMAPIVEKSREPPRMRIIFRNSHHDPCHSILPYSALPLQGLTSYICATSLCIYWRKLKCRIFRPGPSSAQLSVCSKAGHHFRHSSLLYTAEDTIRTSSHAQQAGSRQPPAPRAWRAPDTCTHPCTHAGDGDWRPKHAQMAVQAATSDKVPP